MEILNACTDAPSSLDYSYKEIMLWAVWDVLPDEYKIEPPTIYNQMAQSDTHMACTRYGMYHIVNAQNADLARKTDYKLIEVDPRTKWLKYLTVNPLAQTQWATLQSAMDQAKKDKDISWYALCNWELEMKDSLIHNNLLYTGSPDWDWLYVAETHTYRTRTGNTIGHCVCICGFSPQGWIAFNSLWEEDGLFIIPYSFTNTLFNRYSIFDSKDEQYLLDYNKRIMENINIEDAKKAFEAKIWNGERPTEPASREEVSAMIYRALQQIK